MTDPRVCAVVVTYRPDGEALRAALAAVRPDVHALVVVDNASPGIETALADADAVLLPQPTNVGLARAQNVGRSFRARSRGYALFGVCGALMEHRLGDDRQALPGGRQQVVQIRPMLSK